MTNNQLKLLSALRNPQYQHLVNDIPDSLFTGDRVGIIEAYKIAMRTFGSLSAEAIETAYKGELPPELDIPVTADPFPLIYDLQREARKRSTEELGRELLELSKQHDPDITHIRQLVEKQNDFAPHDTSIIPGIHAFVTDLRAKESNSYRWLKTGSLFLDKMIGGEWPRGEVTIITGRSGGGKTALMGSSALNMGRMALNSEVSPPTIFSMEMPKQQLIARFLADMTGIDSRAIRFGRNVDGTPFSAEDREKINTALVSLQEIPMFIVDTERLFASQIISTAKSLLLEHGSETFFIDYLQLMSYALEDGKHYGLGNAVKELKAFAKRYNVAIVILAQYHEQKETIRDTTDPEKDCALWLHLDIDFDTKDEHGICSATFEIWKNRHGPTGQQTILYDSRRLKFIGNTHEE